MPDIAGNSSTTATITIGGSASNMLEAVGDHDWFRIQLTAGQKITISVDGLTLEDSLVAIRDASGNLLAENDDISSGVVRDSRLVFTAPNTGTYYIDVGAWNDGYAGSYQLNVDLWAPAPVASFQQISEFLVSGYWGGDSHHFNATQGSTITYDFHAAEDGDGVTAAGQNLAREALALWSDITGINFVQVANGGQITFTDHDDGAYSEDTSSNGITTSAFINVDNGWLNTYGSSINTYAFQAYVHEIGHALGLGHGGHYNETATFPDDASFLNDAWPSTIMSYFDQDESSYYDSLGFTRTFVNTPMLADIRAMSTLYGLSTATRTGDTTYGFGNNSGRASYNATQGIVTAYAVFDSGGTDTLNYSGFENNQVVNLNPETFSNVGGGVGNVTIAFNTIIENAIGGGGNDTIIGNGASNTLVGGTGHDTLTGGAGNDIFRDSGFGLNGDVITDFRLGDSIVITNATLAGFTFNLTGNQLSFTGGSLTLQGMTGTLTASAATGGGVQLTIGSAGGTGVVGGRHDFNGDGRDDVLWRHDSGAVTNWLGQANGGFVSNANANAGTDWHIAGTGDFNGDGRDDVLWRDLSGAVTDWLGQANGSFASNFGNAYYQVDNSWQVAGAGDFNADGRDDILWRHDSGAVANWLGQANGGFVSNANANAGTDWQVAGVGDFNGDGRDDVLWRNVNTGEVTDWLGQANGSFASNFEDAHYQVDLGWQVAGVGDFNGDGRDDVLWRHDSGAVINWLGRTNGGFVANANANAGTDWHVASIGDFNGDGRDDVLWRNDDGAVTNWLGQANGSFASNFGNAYYQVDNSWQVQPEPDYFL